jgi:NADPH2:quinone reductase
VHRAIGVNFVDTYHRSGLYPLPLPSGLGVEAAGVVQAVGQGVSEVKKGDRVAYMGPPGAYATARNLAADRLVLLPDEVSAEQAAAAFVKGLTAHMLVTRYRPARAAEPVVVTAAAGGVGQVLVQWLQAIGAEVIAVVGSDEKAEVVRALGAAHVLVTPRDDVPARVRALTGGVPVVYDSVGKASFEASLDCLAPFGLLVTYGNASGPVPPFDTGLLGRKGSLCVARPSVFNHVLGALTWSRRRRSSPGCPTGGSRWRWAGAGRWARRRRPTGRWRGAPPAGRCCWPHETRPAPGRPPRGGLPERGARVEARRRGAAGSRPGYFAAAFSLSISAFCEATSFSKRRMSSRRVASSASSATFSSSSLR